jgi:pimeloyl-ACP methyl ester carboxylesterase
MADELYVAESGNGPTVVMLHGLMAASHMFRWLSESLADRFRLIIPDLPGHGRSRAVGGPYTVEAMSSRLSRSLNNRGISDAHVMGYSHGGAVAQQLALQAPYLVRSLALVATYAFNTATRRELVEGWLTPRLIRVLGMRRLAKLIVRPGVGGGPPLTHEQLDWLRNLLAANDRVAMAEASAGLTTFDSRPWLNRLRLPTLIVSGGRDTAVPAHHATMLAQGIPNAHTTTIGDAGHTMLWTHRDQIAHILADWWEQNPSR